MNEPRETRLKRLRMRSMRRGIKEMDLILMRFSQTELDALSDDELDLYEALLQENDQDIYGWITHVAPMPDHYAALMARVMARADGLTRPGGT